MMPKFQCLNIFIYVALCIVIIIGRSNGDATDNSLPKSSVIEVKSNQENAGGVLSNVLDIHMAMESPNSPTNLKEIIRDELKSLLKLNDFQISVSNSSFESKDEIKSPIVERSVADSLPKSHSNTDLKNSKVTEKHSNCENKISVIDIENACLIDKYALGVRYNSLNRVVNIEKTYHRNCKDVQQSGNNKTGIYEIFPKYAVAPFYVLCDMETRGGGWTYIQRRLDGSEDFWREWRDYKFGFGNLEREFWLGLQNIYLLTEYDKMELLVAITDRDNITAYAHYTQFAIGPESERYRLDKLAGFTGDAGDSLSYHLGQKFSTKDLDDTANICATKFKGAYWYKECHISNLNGKFINVDLPKSLEYSGLHWKTYRSHEYCHAKSGMLIRPAS